MSARKVFGLGTDVTRVSRVLRAWERHGDRFLTRAYADSEIDRFHDLKGRLGNDAAAEFLASRWAVKEAAQKALSHWRVLFPEISVGRGSPWGQAQVGDGGSLEINGDLDLHEGFARLPRDRPGERELNLSSLPRQTSLSGSWDVDNEDEDDGEDDEGKEVLLTGSGCKVDSRVAAPIDGVPSADHSRVRPQLVLSGDSLSLAEGLGLDLAASPLSISHDGEYAVATVLLLSRC